MTNNELFNEVKSISERLKEIFSPIYNSKIISEFYINLLDDLVYRNILENFFNNLTEENNKEYNLNIIDLEKIKNDFKKIQDNIKISSEDVDEVIFTKSYYYSSKSEIIERYPTLEKIFNKLEKIFDLDSIEDFVKNQKLEYVEGRNDYKITLNTLIFEKLIKNKRFKDLLELDQKDLAEVADELIQFEDVEASFVIGKIEQNKVSISARSIGNINVQQIMNSLGGGGSQTSAAAQFQDKTIREAKEKLLKIIR